MGGLPAGAADTGQFQWVGSWSSPALCPLKLVAGKSLAAWGLLGNLGGQRLGGQRLWRWAVGVGRAQDLEFSVDGFHLFLFHRPCAESRGCCFTGCGPGGDGLSVHLQPSRQVAEGPHANQPLGKNSKQRKKSRCRVTAKAGPPSRMLGHSARPARRGVCSVLREVLPAPKTAAWGR